MRVLPQRRLLLGAIGAVLITATLTMGTAVAAKTDRASFKMQVSGGAAKCLPNASADVRIRSIGPVELMDVDVKGLPPKTDFDLFVIQVPTAPFGVSWYQGDIETNRNGEDHRLFIGRFSIETFALSNGPVTPPQVHTGGMFPDATEGVAFKPIHTYHLGLWFNSPSDAVKAGCAGTQTAFNGDHTAGIQVLNTGQFAADQGPLRQVVP